MVSGLTARSVIVRRAAGHRKSYSRTWTVNRNPLAEMFNLCELERWEYRWVFLGKNSTWNIAFLSDFLGELFLPVHFWPIYIYISCLYMHTYNNGVVSCFHDKFVNVLKNCTDSVNFIDLLQIFRFETFEEFPWKFLRFFYVKLTTTYVTLFVDNRLFQSNQINRKISSVEGS